MVFVFNQLACFTYHNAPQIHPCCHKIGAPFFFLLPSIPLYKCVRFFMHSFIDGHLGCFQHLAIVNSAAVNMGIHEFFWIGVSGFLGCIASSGISGSKDSSIFSFLRKIPQWLHQSAFPPTVW